MEITKNRKGISPTIATIIISGTLLIILVIASFVSANVLELQIANTEFEQAKTNMILLDQVIQDVAMRRGAGGYAQFNQRSGGINIIQHTETITVLGPPKQTAQTVTLRPNAAGSYQEWETVVGTSHWSATSDQTDSTYIQTVGQSMKRDIQNLQDPTFNNSAIVNSVNVLIRAYALGSGSVEDLNIMQKLGASERITSKTITRNVWNEYSTGPQATAPDGASWTKQKVTDLQAGTQVQTLAKDETLRVSEIRIVVNYTALQPDLIYNSPFLVSLVYRGGSKVSGTDLNITGNNKLNVSLTDPLGYLRVETDNGLKIKLDYFRVRIVEIGSLIVNGTLTNFIEITFLRLTKGNMGGTDTINVKAQNTNINTATHTYTDESITIQVELGTKTLSSTFSSEAPQTVVMFSEIVVQISTA